MHRRPAKVEPLESRRHLDAVPYHLQLAEQLVANIAPANNSYVYGTPSVTWAGLDGATAYSNKSDCSTFDTALLTEAYHFTAKQFTQWTGTSTPQAKDYYNAAIADDGFIGYSSVASVQPGDDMFMKYLDSTTDTGHVVTIVSAPSLVSTSSTQRIYNLTVIDSTTSPHSSDTRVSGETGVGEGTMRIYTDLSGNLTAYSWGTSASSVVETAATRPATFAKIPSTTVLTIPLAPSGLVATAMSGGSNSITWIDHATNEGGYNVQRSIAGSPFTTIISLPANTTSYVDTGLTAGKKYVYRVDAFNSAGNSDWSTSLTVVALTASNARQQMLNVLLGT